MKQRFLTEDKRRWKRNTPHICRRWTDAQQAVFDSPYELTVFWGGNGMGKSWCIAELTRRALAGELWWQRKGEPQIVILAGNTWSQLGSTIMYFMELADPRWFPGIRYEGGAMKGQRFSVYDVKDGPGKGGQLRLGVFNAKNLAGPRADAVITDEPLDEKTYNELRGRLVKGGRQGRMYQTFTPTTGTAHDLDYLWRMVDDPDNPRVGEINEELSVASVTPRGGLVEVPWLRASQIESFERSLSAATRDIRMGRSRVPLNTDAVYDAWGPHLILDHPPAWLTRAFERPAWEQRRHPVEVGIGIDHGSKPGAERMVLCYCLGRGQGERARIWIPDEYVSVGRSTMRQDARGLLSMLDQNGLELGDVDFWVADRAHRAGRHGHSKSNERLLHALAHELGIKVPQLPRKLREIQVPYKSDRSVDEGVDIVHQHMLLGPEHYAVHKGCTQLAKDHTDWRGGSTEPAKDGCDAERYILTRMIFGADVGRR